MSVYQSEFELGVANNDAAGLGVLRGLGVNLQADRFEPPGQVFAERPGHLINGDIDVVPFFGLGRRGKDRAWQLGRLDQALGQAVAADRSRPPIILPDSRGRRIQRGSLRRGARASNVRRAALSIRPTATSKVPPETRSGRPRAYDSAR